MKFNKSIILSILLLCCSAQAEKIAAGVYKSDVGGEIRLQETPR